jgi:SAM-dependent methyltransferase
MGPEAQTAIDQANRQFWEELCGNGLARSLGITDHSTASLRRFDDAYFGIYPYLLPIVQPERMQGARVLEIGLGYGTLGQKLAEASGEYFGLDIAAKPVALMRHRLQMLGRTGRVFQGTSHDIPLANESVDFVVSIGCFHHTGNVQRCLDETFRVLRPGGLAVVMVYNRFSFRQWTRWPFTTLREATRLAIPFRKTAQLTEEQRRAYDSNEQGVAAPESVCLSIGELRKMLGSFRDLRFRKRNCDPLVLRGRLLFKRETLLSTLGRLLGLDIYLEARKPGNLGRSGATVEASRDAA